MLIEAEERRLALERDWHSAMQEKEREIQEIRMRLGEREREVEGLHEAVDSHRAEAIEARQRLTVQSTEREEAARMNCELQEELHGARIQDRVESAELAELRQGQQHWHRVEQELRQNVNYLMAKLRDGERGTGAREDRLLEKIKAQRREI